MVTSEQLLQSGISLVSMPYGEKGPVDDGWNLRDNCIFDASQAYLLNGKNVGIAHAYCTPAPTCAIDIDNYKIAKLWLASHGVDLDVFINAPDSVVIWSGKKNSLKILYQLSTGSLPLASKKINGPDGKSAIEFRCASKSGRTVQDVLPPSLHPDGHQYKWVGNGNPLQLSEIPSGLLTVWLTLISNASRVALRTRNSQPQHHLRQESAREIALIRDALNYINADCPYEIWRNIIWAIQSTAWLCAEDLARDWSMSALHRYDEDAFWLVANSYLPDHQCPITIGTIYYHARMGGWHG
jgi:putative DNA primase/helicase